MGPCCPESSTMLAQQDHWVWKHSTCRQCLTHPISRKASVAAVIISPLPVQQQGKQVRTVPKQRSWCTANIWQVSVEPLPPWKLPKPREGRVGRQAPEHSGALLLRLRGARAISSFHPHSNVSLYLIKSHLTLCTS